jgi:hypothetical protein
MGWASRSLVRTPHALSRSALAAAFAAFAAFAAAACGDGKGPGPDVPPSPLDSRVAELAAARVEGIVNQQVLRAMLTAADDPAAGSSSSSGAATAGQRLGIPMAARGRVYLYDAQQGRWVADPTRTDALANGVRFMLGPRVGTPNAPVVGFVDVGDVVAGGVQGLSATVTSAATHVAMTYGQRSTGMPFEPGYADTVLAQVRGTGGNGSLSSFAYESVEPIGNLGQGVDRWRAGWSLSSGDLIAETGGIMRNAPGDSNYTVMELGGRTLRLVNRHVPDPENPPFYTMNDTTRAYLDEKSYALIVQPAAAAPGGAPKFLRPDGTPLPAEEQATLTRLETSTASVVQVLFLPYLVRLWLADLSYPGGP